MRRERFVSPWSRDARFSAMKMRSLMNLLTGALRLTLTLTLTLSLTLTLTLTLP
jgi:hypothetical protein